MSRIFVSAMAVIGLCIASASAQTHDLASSCLADVHHFCAETKPGEGRILSCIQEHSDQLSQSCRAAIVRATTVARACIGDVHEHCAGIRPGNGRITACMVDHVGSLSVECKSAVAAELDARQMVVVATPGTTETLPIMLDMSKVTCAQVFEGRLSRVAMIGSWLSGYYHGKAGNSVLDFQKLDAAVDKVGRYCVDHPDTAIMSAVDAVVESH